MKCERKKTMCSREYKKQRNASAREGSAVGAGNRRKGRKWTEKNLRGILSASATHEKIDCRLARMDDEKRKG